MRILPFFALIVSASAFAEAPLQLRTEEFFPLRPDGHLTISLSDGSIHVYGSREPEVRLISVRNAYTRARLRQIEVRTKSQPGRLSVSTYLPPVHGIFADRSGTIDFTVVVPETATLEKLSLINGEVSIQGLRGGKAYASIVNGRITCLNTYADVHCEMRTGLMEIFYQWWEPLPAQFDCAIRYGPIRVRMPRSAQFKIDAQTSDGHIGKAFGLPPAQPKGTGQLLLGATGPNTSLLLHLRTGSGNIDLESFQ